MKYKIHLKRNNKGAKKMDAVIARKGISSVHSAEVTTVHDTDEVLDKLKESGKKLNDILDVRQRHINKAIRDARKEWK